MCALAAKDVSTAPSKIGEKTGRKYRDVSLGSKDVSG
jgi:hypothetical protein